MKSIYFFLAVFIVNTITAQTQRMVLIEEFSGANCGPCAAANPAVNTLMANNTSKVIFLKYQVDIPSADPILYPQTSAVVDPRMTFYGVNSAPEGYQDGLAVGDGHVSRITQTTINTAYAVTSPFFMRLNASLTPNNDSINFQLVVKAAQDFNGVGLKAYLAVAETEINFATPPGSTSEKDFHHVVRGMHPNASGTTLNSTWLNGDSTVISGKIKVPSVVYSLDRLELVAWVQSATYKNVYQSVKVSPLALGSQMVELNINDNTLKPGLCESSINSSYNIQNTSNVTLTSCSLRKKMALVGGTTNTITQDWTGNLGLNQIWTANESLPIPAEGVYSLLTELYNINFLNGADINRMNNATSKMYFSRMRDAVRAPLDYYFEGFESATSTVGRRFTNTTMAEISAEYAANVKSGAGGFGTSTRSYFFDGFNAVEGVVLSLMTDKINMTTFPSSYLFFDYAHRRYSTGTSERLQVEVSTDCGATWTTLWDKSGATLATNATALTTAFTPTATNWKKDSVSLAAYAGATELMARFKFTSDYGNNVWIDNIIIGSGSRVTGIEENVLSARMSVFPNPSNGLYQLTFDEKLDKNAEFKVFDMSGKLVLSKNIVNEIEPIDLSNFNKGIYQLRVTSANKTGITKLIKN